MTSPVTEHWPLTGLRLRTRVAAGDLELRLPDAADLAALAALAAQGVHDPASQPFAVAWTDAEPAARALSTMQYHWLSWASWTPQHWDLNLVAVLNGTVTGTQGVAANDFAVLREVGTGSWLGQAYQGQGIGTAMREAVLALSFDGLGAEYATSSAFTDNPSSRAVSRRLGYAEDGVSRQVSRGKPATTVRLRIDRASWAAHKTTDVSIEGLTACLPLFGIG
jgi:RimJ/RimL family protein N-acetyltransferase